MNLITDAEFLRRDAGAIAVQLRRRAMRVTDIEDIQGGLNRLLADARRLIGNSRVNFEDSRALAAHVTEMRVLLDTLCRLQEHMNFSGSGYSLCRIKEEFFELEGVVKELRNAQEQTSALKRKS